MPAIGAFMKCILYCVHLVYFVRLLFCKDHCKSLSEPSVLSCSESMSSVSHYTVSLFLNKSMMTMMIGITLIRGIINCRNRASPQLTQPREQPVPPFPWASIPAQRGRMEWWRAFRYGREVPPPIIFARIYFAWRFSPDVLRSAEPPCPVARWPKRDPCNGMYIDSIQLHAAIRSLYRHQRSP